MKLVLAALIATGSFSAFAIDFTEKKAEKIQFQVNNVTFDGYFPDFYAYVFDTKGNRRIVVTLKKSDPVYSYSSSNGRAQSPITVTLEELEKFQSYLNLVNSNCPANVTVTSAGVIETFALQCNPNE